MRKLGYRWRQGELRDALVFWTGALIPFTAMTAALVIVALRWPW